MAQPTLVSLAKIECMQLVEVTTRDLEQQWVLFPAELYKNDPLYIRPIDQEVKDVFAPNKNKVFNFDKTEAIRWILKDGSKTIGRIAAFVNGKICDSEDQPTGGCGFFDCIDDQDAANTLFQAAKDWLEERGIEAMDGPVNLGERDKNWGVLIDGFAEQNYGMNYNAPYYQALYEGFGFQLYFNQYTFGRTFEQSLDFTERFYEKANITLNDPDFEYRRVTKAEFKNEIAEYFLEVYNKAWGGHGGVKPMNIQQVNRMFKKLKPIADLNLLWFGFHKGQPISFFLSIPELNQVFKHVNGNMNWWGKLKFMYYLKTGAVNKCLGIVFGVVPEHHGKGVEAAMVVAYSKMAWSENLPYKSIEMNWIGDFNPKMMRVCEQLSATIWRTHATYRYLFDRNKEFKRCPIID